MFNLQKNLMRMQIWIFSWELFFLIGIKDYSNWPTIPQVYFKGEFIGGCDILLQMHQSGELIEELQKIGITSALLAQDEAEKDKWLFM